MKLIHVPYDKGSMDSNVGCKKTPKLLTKALEEIGSKRGGLPHFEVGDVNVVEGNVDVTMESVEDTAGDLFIGGDHSITYGSVKQFANKYKSGFGLVIFDAHPDVEESSGSVTHEDYLRSLIEEQVVDPENILLVGLRDVSKNESKFLKDRRIKTFLMKQWSSETLIELTESIMEFASSFPSVYVSFDIDVIDPVYAPGTGNLSVGGFTSKEALYLVRRMKRLKNLRGFDLVEINPDKDVNDITMKLGVEILYEILNRE